MLDGRRRSSALAAALGGTAPSRRLANTCFWSLLGGSLAFYGAALYLGFHEGRLVVDRGLTPEQAEEATPLHPFLIMGGGHRDARRLLAPARDARALASDARGPRARRSSSPGAQRSRSGRSRGPCRPFPAVNELLDRGGDAGDVIVNLHAQLNMLGGLMVILIGLALAPHAGSRLRVAAARDARLGVVAAGMAVYYGGGIAFSAVAAHRVAGGGTFGARSPRSSRGRRSCSCRPPWPSRRRLRRVRARRVARDRAPTARTGRGVCGARRRPTPAASPSGCAGAALRRSPATSCRWACSAFPGVGWLFAGFPFAGIGRSCSSGRRIAWAAIPLAFTPFANGPLARSVGRRSSSGCRRARCSRRRCSTARTGGGVSGCSEPRHDATLAATAAIARAWPSSSARSRCLLVALPFVPAVAGIGGSTVRYAYQTRFTREVTGQFLATPRGNDQALRLARPAGARFPRTRCAFMRATCARCVVRAAAVDAPAAYRLFDLDGQARARSSFASSSPHELVLAPGRRSGPGRYVFAASHEGMFGGRDFAYFTVVAPGRAGHGRSRRRADGSRPRSPDAVPTGCRGAPRRCSSRPPARSLLRKPAGQKALWAIGFALFAVAAASEAAAQRAGWSPACSVPTTSPAEC